MSRASLLTVTALGEGGMGIALLLWPSALLGLLLGVDRSAPEALLVGRIAGAALVAIAVACWLGRGDAAGGGQFGLVAGALVFDAAAAGLLGYAGSVLDMAGPALWPAVVLHALLAVWCVLCLEGRREIGKTDAGSGGPASVR